MCFATLSSAWACFLRPRISLLAQNVLLFRNSCSTAFPGPCWVSAPVCPCGSPSAAGGLKGAIVEKSFAIPFLKNGPILEKQCVLPRYVDPPCFRCRFFDTVVKNALVIPEKYLRVAFLKNGCIPEKYLRVIFLRNGCIPEKYLRYLFSQEWLPHPSPFSLRFFSFLLSVLL